jgi:hypothetical protein
MMESEQTAPPQIYFYLCLHYTVVYFAEYLVLTFYSKYIFRFKMLISINILMLHNILMPIIFYFFFEFLGVFLGSL